MPATGPIYYRPNYNRQILLGQRPALLAVKTPGSAATPGEPIARLLLASSASAARSLIHHAPITLVDSLRRLRNADPAAARIYTLETSASGGTPLFTDTSSLSSDFLFESDYARSHSYSLTGYDAASRSEAAAHLQSIAAQLHTLIAAEPDPLTAAATHLYNTETVYPIACEARHGSLIQSTSLDYTLYASRYAAYVSYRHRHSRPFAIVALGCAPGAHIELPLKLQFSGVHTCSGILSSLTEITPVLHLFALGDTWNNRLPEAAPAAGNLTPIATYSPGTLTLSLSGDGASLVFDTSLPITVPESRTIVFFAAFAPGHQLSLARTLCPGKEIPIQSPTANLWNGFPTVIEDALQLTLTATLSL
ncbi:MAG: hypothetical protein IKM62_01350 [Kiritimatiellae bacterium]|nr:hypothetical protein [Kiritimatiellia bacterium]